MARRSTLVCATSGSRPCSRSSSPPRRASASPLALRSTSTQPVNRFLAFHSLSPCRNRTSTPALPPLMRLILPSALAHQPGRPVVLRRHHRALGDHFELELDALFDLVVHTLHRQRT